MIVLVWFKAPNGDAERLIRPLFEAIRHAKVPPFRLRIGAVPPGWELYVETYESHVKPVRRLVKQRFPTLRFAKVADSPNTSIQRGED